MSLATEDVVFYAIIAFIVIENSIEIYLSRRQVSYSSTSKLLDKFFVPYRTMNNKSRIVCVVVRVCVRVPNKSSIIFIIDNKLENTWINCSF